ncbi:efflux RND transporter periplasmic adaptor subunit [Aquibium oceanicum]|uniref:Efflux transporter periplasmic adaptor subunit n=1 Tax=Aquibium oceanicum TaxID=1670800 RepID=A0A1L3SNP7_9HYPH|nr:efflux RND transporter periplasmic adaptor subunit [Aquibium oceanicum]APH71026.1 efflux transporter periplasmic adaptor subunit [Aquibium oceanicum]
MQPFIRSLVLLTLICTGPSFAQDPGDEGAGSNAAAAALTVEAINPTMDDWAETVPANGWLAAWQEAAISAEISGQRITSVDGEVGDIVKAGQELARLSSDKIESEVQQREADLESARAAFDEAKANGDRARKLKGSGAATDQQITEYLVAERKAQADLDSAEAALASSRVDLEHTRILAVDDGTISARSASLGDVVATGDELFKLIRQSRIEWQAEIPLKQLRHVAEGTRAVIPTPIGDVEGTVRKIAPTASEKTGRVTAYVSLVPPDGDHPNPKTGIFVSGYFDVGSSQAISVPSSAITLRDGFSYVYVIEDGSPTTVSRKRVETGRRNGDRVEITSGLEGNETLVKAGGAFLADGSVVRLVSASDADDNAAGAAGAAPALDDAAASSGEDAGQ